jgi:hypothetical protein
MRLFIAAANGLYADLTEFNFFNFIRGLQNDVLRVNLPIAIIQLHFSASKTTVLSN